MNKFIFSILLLTLASVSQNSITQNTHKMSSSDLKTTMRKLWMDHGVWTHEFIVSFFEEFPNNSTDLTLKRLLQNQEDIGNAVGSFYGAKAGEQLTKLLKEHILISGDVLKAAKANNQNALKIANNIWHNNAKEIASFLSKANSNWKYPDLLDMLNNHLSLTTKEAMAWFKHKWDEEIKLYDEVLNQLLHMADDLTEGISKQFNLK